MCFVNVLKVHRNIFKPPKYLEKNLPGIDLNCVTFRHLLVIIQAILNIKRTLPRSLILQLDQREGVNMDLTKNSGYTRLLWISLWYQRLRDGRCHI